MEFICVLCDQKKEIEERSPVAKRLMNHPQYVYLCDHCNERIKVRRLERIKQKEESQL